MSAPPTEQTAQSSTSSQQSNQSHESSSSLPRFTSIRNRTPSFEKGESSSLESWRASNRGTVELPDIGDKKGASETIQETANDGSNDVTNHGSHRHRARHSGAFLLDTVFRPSAKRLSHGSSTIKPKHDDKGKRRSEDGGIVIPKRRATHHHHHPQQSIGSSPLAVEQTDALNGNTSINRHHPTITFQSSGSHADRSTHAAAPTLDEKFLTSHHQPFHTRNQRASVPAIGFDTDPAQIVNLALNLSENRRRTFSGGRFVSDGSRRVVSSGQASSSPVDAQNHVRQGGSLRQHLMQQRKISRNISPSSLPMHNASIASPKINGQAARRASRAVSRAAPEDLSDEEEVEYEVSEATLARAAKARQHFELFYEHRRLMSLLPPLRNAPSRAPPGAESDVDDSYQPGRAYNPLQYIRNRKLRWREKNPLWSEADGWNDIDKVRPWIDAVANDHKEPSNDPDECVRLPQLQDERYEPEEDSSPASPLRRPATNVSQKPRRPRMDWIISPPDLLADAFWLEQGLNKTKIEDGQGKKLYPWDAQLRFTGWRNRPPAITQESEMSSANASIDRLNVAPEMPVFKSRSQDGSEGQRRSRRRHKLRDSIHGLHGSQSGSSDRRFGLRKKLTRSVSRSSSADSEAEGFRGRKKQTRKAIDPSPQGLSSVALEKQMLAMLERESGETTPLSSQQANRGSINSNGFGTSIQGDRHARETSREGIIFKSDLFKERNRSTASLGKASPHATPPLRSSVEQQRARTSIEEMDSTAPNSPVANGFVPSIAINLSPPNSRSPSPTKKSVSSRFFRPDRSPSKQRHGISAGDFMVEERKERPGRSSAEAQRPLNNRDASPRTKRSSLTPEDEGLIDLRRTQSAQVRGSKPIPQTDTRRRGMFKGGRIAEIVGNEVSRVGDFIWKRDAPQHARLPSSASSVPSEDSGGELDIATDGPKQTTKAALGRYATNDDGGRLGRRITEKEPPRYYMNNLPTFRSPFKQEEPDSDVFNTPHASPQDDPTPRQQRDHRETSRDGRFERLGPPRIDIRGVSPTTPRNFEKSQSPGDDRRDSYGFGKAMSANRRLNDPWNENRGDILLSRPPVTALASLEASNTPRRRRPTLNGQPEWSISQRSISTSREAPTSKADIARVRALLVSSGVKATEISRRAHAVRDPIPDFILQIARNEPLPLIPRKEEHVVAARILVREIDATHQAHQDALEKFSNATVPALHGRIRDLDDLVSNSLIVRARSAADDAGAQSSQLTTTRTLSVKQLNDGIDLVIRRRRRRLRWARRFGYVLLEWTVLGLLWWVWLVVMVIKIIKGSFHVFASIVKWILFL